MKPILILILLGSFAIKGFSQGDTLIIAMNDSTQLKLVKDKFDKELHEIVYWESGKQAITSIDGKPVFGTDATIPETELIFAELTLRNEKISLETYGMFDPWPETGSIVSYQVEKFLGNPLRIRCLFSNGTGAYLAEWTIVGNKAFRTMITHDLKVIDAVNFKE